MSYGRSSAALLRRLLATRPTRLVASGRQRGLHLSHRNLVVYGARAMSDQNQAKPEVEAKKLEISTDSETGGSLDTTRPTESEEKNETGKNEITTTTAKEEIPEKKEGSDAIMNEESEIDETRDVARKDEVSMNAAVNEENKAVVVTTKEEEGVGEAMEPMKEDEGAETMDTSHEMSEFTADKEGEMVKSEAETEMKQKSETVKYTNITTNNPDKEQQSTDPGTDEDPQAKKPKQNQQDSPSHGFFSRLIPGYTRSVSTPAARNYSDMPQKDRRQYYTCGRNYCTLSQIEPWSESYKKHKPTKLVQPCFEVDDQINKKISLWRGDITRLEVDAIVNAANSSLLGGGGVDGAIHRAAGGGLLNECRKLGGCNTGYTKLTKGHRLPANYVLHTVGPMDSDSEMLKSCYETSLELVLKHNITSVAFPCIATGIYGFPNRRAAEIALKVTREWLEKHKDKVTRIIFCVFLDVDLKHYINQLHVIYPISNENLHIQEDSTNTKPAENAKKSETMPTPMMTSISDTGASLMAKVTGGDTANNSNTTSESGEPETKDVDSGTGDSEMTSKTVDTTKDSKKTNPNHEDPGLD